MSDDQLNTYFDSPERSSPSEIREQKDAIKRDPLIAQLLNSFPDPIMILNKNRQIVAYNAKALELFNGFQPEEIYGLRVGEALNCIHSHEGPNGCGTTAACVQCGAAQCIKFTADTGNMSDDECRISFFKGGVERSFDLRVQTSIINYRGEDFTVFAAKSIEDEKRKQILERVFFHDLLNTAGALYGLSSMLTDIEDISEMKSYSSMLQTTSSQLIQEIRAQRDIASAETGNLKIAIEKYGINDIIESAASQYKKSDLLHKRSFEVMFDNSSGMIETDKTVLVRCLGNLIKNALEASEDNTEVKLWTNQTKDFVIFNVKNDGVIPAAVKPQIFKRSFSTKAKTGRGLGTYSVKLFTQQYLKGSVTFISDETNGTVFSLTIPKVYPGQVIN